MIIAPPNPETRKIVSLVTDLEVRMKRAEAGLRAAQLGNASIQGAGLNVYDDNGTVRTVIGRQGDGTYTATSINNPNPPPVPSSPIVVPALASLIVRHTGETATGVGWPADLDHLNIYYALAQNPDDWTAGPSLGTGWPEEIPIGPLEYTSYLVAVTAVNHSGKESEKSVPVSGAPNQVVPQDLIDGIFADLELNANTVSEAALQAGAVTETKIANDAVTSPKVVAGGILAVNIAASQINGGHMIAEAVTAREIKALAVVAGKIDVNAVTAGTIAAGVVQAVMLEANLVLAGRIIAGAAAGNRVEMHPTLGIQAFSGGGATRSFWLDAATGSALLIGEIRSAATGARIIINPGGNQPDRIQFWPDNVGSSVDYAYIDSFPEGQVDTGILMQASGGQSTRVGTIWLRKAYAALGIAANDLTVNSHFYAEPNFVRCRSATVDLIVDQAVTPLNGPRRVAILNYSTSGVPVANSGIYYITATANQYPMLFSPPFGCGIIWDGGGYLAFVNGNTTTYDRIPVEASQFRVASDTRMKRDIGEFEWSALETIRQSPAKRWKRRTGPRETHRNDPMVEGYSPPEEPWLFGPMADDLPGDLVHTDSDSDMRKIDLGSMIGVLWKAVEELSSEVRTLKSAKDK